MKAYLQRKCGCEVIGDGTEPSPLAIEFCHVHAAAPDLLAALERLYGVLASDGHGFHDGTETGRAMRQARNSIAKAKPAGVRR
jgi:hypothetical protein